MSPFEVPMIIDAATARQVGRPKFRFPNSEKACPEIFFSLVHRTTSHGGCGVSAPSEFWRSWLESDDCLECGPRKAGESALGESRGEVGILAENLRSKGCKEGGR